MEEILKQSSVQTLVQVLMSTFSHVYSENGEQKACVKVSSFIRRELHTKLIHRRAWLLKRLELKEAKYIRATGKTS